MLGLIAQAAVYEAAEPPRGSAEAPPPADAGHVALVGGGSAGTLDLAALREELDRAEAEALGGRSSGAAGPMETHTTHLWPLPGPPQQRELPPARPPSRPAYTKGVRVSEHADDDIAAAAALRGGDLEEAERGERHAFLRELEHKWAFKHLDQRGELEDANADKRVAWRRTVEELFCDDSSDDSDGVDPDHDDEWGPATNRIFAACRGVQAHPESEQAVAAFVDMLSATRGTDATPTERMMVWDAVRFLYRDAEAVHHKKWLTQCTHLAAGGAFAHRPSLAAFLHASAAASTWPPLHARHRRKAARWATRVMVLFHKRVAALREYGSAEPTWAQVHVAPDARAETIPSGLLHEAVEIATEMRQRAAAAAPTHAAEEEHGIWGRPRRPTGSASAHAAASPPAPAQPPWPRGPAQPHNRPPA